MSPTSPNPGQSSPPPLVVVLSPVTSKNIEGKRQSVIDTLLDVKDARDFWKTNFGSEMSVTTSRFLEVASRQFALDADTVNALELAVDHNKDGSITIYELGKFSFPTLTAAISAVKTVPATTAGITMHNDAKEAGVNVLWCDPNPQNNKVECQAAADRNIVIKQVESAKEGIAWLSEEGNSAYLHAQNFRIICNNALYGVPEGVKLSESEIKNAKMSASEDIVRFLRARRSNVPVLVYCNFTYPQAEEVCKRYRRVKATKSKPECVNFLTMSPISW